MRSNLRWCSDGFEFTCWNGDVIRGAFLIDAHDREIISWRAVVNAGSEGDTAIGPRYGPERLRHPRSAARSCRAAVLGPARAIGHRGSHRSSRRGATGSSPAARGSPYIAKETRVFAQQLGLQPCFTPERSPQSNGMSEAFVKTLKRDYVQVMPLPDA